MSIQYFNIELIPPQSHSYINNNRRYKRLSGNIRKYKAIDHFSATYNKTLLKWESVVQRLLATLACETPNRILKYTSSEAAICYREIDFIAQASENEFVFCELKLKEGFNEALGSKASGWAQLNKSLNIATYKYQKLGGLSICVDMSHVYGLESKASTQDYCKFSELENHLNTVSENKETLWLNSEEVASLAIENGLLTAQEINDIKIQYEEFKDPLSTIKNAHAKIVNNPFQSLIELKNNSSCVVAQT
jgi:hypothetical protein